MVVFPSRPKVVAMETKLALLYLKHIHLSFSKFFYNQSKWPVSGVFSFFRHFTLKRIPIPFFFFFNLLFNETYRIFSEHHATVIYLTATHSLQFRWKIKPLRTQVTLDIDMVLNEKDNSKADIHCYERHFYVIICLLICLRISFDGTNWPETSENMQKKMDRLSEEMLSKKS